jgi:hypothetical protein
MDCVQEVFPDKGRMVLKTLHMFKHSTSIFDDFIHYEKRQEEDEGRRVPPPQVCNYAFYQCLAQGADPPVSVHLGPAG